MSAMKSPERSAYTRVTIVHLVTRVPGIHRLMAGAAISILPTPMIFPAEIMEIFATASGFVLSMVSTTVTEIAGRGTGTGSEH